MLICGLKLTHDGSVALLDDDRLVCSVEVEKLGNRPRYSKLDDLDLIPAILRDFGYGIGDVDEFVIDGWDGSTNGRIAVTDQGRLYDLLVAPYHEDVVADALATAYRGTFLLAGVERPFRSFVHVGSHLASAYCTSPFAERREPALGLVWDGGMFPRLYCVTADGVENGGPIFPLIGHVYATAGHHFGPFKRVTQSDVADDLSVAGKLMAYIALGAVRKEIVDALYEAYDDHFAGNGRRAETYRRCVGGWGTKYEHSVAYLHDFFDDVAAVARRLDIPDVDVLSSVHLFLQELLLEKLGAKIRAWKGTGPWNLTFSGGCGLNIKWNSALRADPLFGRVWVPPFPNDSGAALGAAACRLAERDGTAPALRWHVRTGPALLPTTAPFEGWSAEPCDAAGLAGILHETHRPVVLVDGRSELGPRALGGRSILAAPTDAAMKDTLNDLKGREDYRPVAPICLVEAAPGIFDPGTPDPYMLFEHRVRAQWRDRIPAVVHLDGTARLQTVSADDDVFLCAVLREYHRLSGIPVLCNTSANLNGRGFFPDVASAVSWGKVDFVYSDSTLYRRDI